MWDWCGDKSKTYGGTSYAEQRRPGPRGRHDDYQVQGCVHHGWANMEVGEALWVKGHIGVYIGNGLAVECTPAWKNQVQVTAVGIHRRPSLATIPDLDQARQAALCDLHRREHQHPVCREQHHHETHHWRHYGCRGPKGGRYRGVHRRHPLHQQQRRHWCQVQSRARQRSPALQRAQITRTISSRRRAVAPQYMGGSMPLTSPHPVEKRSTP